MAAHTLGMIMYAEDGVTELGTINFNSTDAPGSYAYYLRNRTPALFTFKDQWQNSPILDGQALVDYRHDVQQETIVIDARATTAPFLQLSISIFNHWMEQIREAQRNKNRGLPYRRIMLLSNLLSGLTSTSKTEVLAMNVELPETYMSNATLVNLRIEKIVVHLTLVPYWTASTLNIISAQSVANAASNYVNITGDTTTYAVTNAVLTSNVATLTIGTHSLLAGDTVTVSNVSLSSVFNGTYKLSSVAATTISYARVNANIGSAASTGSVVGLYVKSSRSAPLRVKVAGGTSATNKLTVALRKQGTPSDFVHVYWSKDATMTGNTAARNADTTFSGNGTNNGTRTTAANTSENKTHRWTNTTNVSSQFGVFRVFLRCRSNTAARYSVRVRAGLTDGTNYIYPPNGGYATGSALTVTTDSGNALAWIDCGIVRQPAKPSGTNTIYGIVYEIYATCSDTSGTPTFDVDGMWLFPISEGENGTGLCSAVYDLGTAASGVGYAYLDALQNTTQAYLANGSDVMTFPTLNLPDGAALWIEPQRAHRIYFALIDESTSAGNPRHDYTQTLTVTIDHEVRYGTEGRLD